MPNRTASEGEGAGPVTVSLLVEGRAGGEVAPRLLDPGASLHSGDCLSLRVQVDRRAYLYVVLYAKEGWSELVFPTITEEPVAPGLEIRVPQGDWIELDEHAGEETIYVVASSRPLFLADPALVEQLRLWIGMIDGRPVLIGRGEKKPPPPPPEGMGPRDRGDDVRTREREHTLQQRAGADGVALLRFSFRHL